MLIKLIIGLRNPGANYTPTRHNAGEWFLHALAEHYTIHYTTNKPAQSEVGQFVVDNHPCKTLLPLTFMNHNGQSAQAIAGFYRITPEQILVVHDELDLAPGEIRIKTGGGHGGHNGLRDLISHLGSPNFHRLRIGIGHPGHKDLVVNYVLGKPSVEDKNKILNAIDSGIFVLPQILSGDMTKAMQVLHTKA